MLGPDHFSRFSAACVRRLVASCRHAGIGTVYHTCGNTMHLVGRMAETGVDAVSLDSPAVGIDLPTVAKNLPPDVAILGNLNPTGSILSGHPAEVEAETTDLLKQMDACQNFVLSTGCDLPQETPIKNIHAFMRAGRRHQIQ
jgi:uroporphyrinogen decarboxylase